MTNESGPPTNVGSNEGLGVTGAEALRPCPFCGGRATKVHHYYANRKGDDGEFYHVVRFHGMCTECGAQGPTMDTLHHQHAEARAVRAWNGDVTPNASAQRAAEGGPTGARS